MTADASPSGGPRGALALRAAAALSLLCYAGHALGHYARIGDPQGALWACHVGALLIALGLALGSPRINAVGVSWLSFGTPLWLVDLAGGGELIPTSFLTHVVALALGLWGVAKMGFPPGTWWRALASLLALQHLSRLVLSPEGNVNVAFAVPPGLRSSFSSYGSCWVVMSAVVMVVMVAAELLLRRLTAERVSPHRGGGLFP